MSNLTVSRRVVVVSKKGEDNASRQSEGAHHPHTESSEVNLKSNLWSLDELNFVWKDLSRKNTETLTQLLSEDLDDCYRNLAEILNISDYRDNARSSILLDYHFWNLSFAIQECQFNKEKTSVFFSIMKYLLEKLHKPLTEETTSDHPSTPHSTKKKSFEERKRPTLEEVFQEFKSILLTHTAIIQQTINNKTLTHPFTSPSNSFSNNIPNSKTSPSNSFANLTRNSTSPPNSFTLINNGNTNASTTNTTNPIPPTNTVVPTTSAPSPPTPIHFTTKLPRKSIGLNSPASSGDSSVIIPPAPPLPPWRGFTIEDAKIITDYATSTFFQHFNLYQEVFSRNQEVAQKTKLIHIDTPVNPPQLSIALSEEEWREQTEMMHVTEEIRNARELLLEKERLEKEKDENLDESRDGLTVPSELNGNESDSTIPSQDKSNSPLSGVLENLSNSATVLGPEKILEIVNTITSNQVSILSEALQKQYEEQERHLMNLITKVDNELERLSTGQYPTSSINPNPNSLSLNTSPSNVNLIRTPSVNQGFNSIQNESDQPSQALDSLSPKTKVPTYASGVISPLPLSSNEKFMALEKKGSLAKLNVMRKKSGASSVPPNLMQDL